MYLWLKILHISAMAVWFTGLFFLPRLFIAAHRGEIDGETRFFNPVANTLYFRLMTPAALITTVLGTVLIAYNPDGAWLTLKLALVACAVMLHIYLGVLLYEMGQGRDHHGTTFYTVVGWLPLLLLLAIAAVTAGKPESAARLPAPPSGEMTIPAELGPLADSDD